MNKHEISTYIRSQFPTAYDEGGENFIAFVEAYYEFVDINYFQNKTVLETMDIDNTLNEFVLHFKETYLKDFPFVAATDKIFMIKHIQDFYKSKGSTLSTQLLLKMLFNEESYINLPSKDILRASESNWYEPEYIEVSRSDRTIGFLNKSITGSKSRAKGIVEGIVTKRINGKYIDVVYLSSTSGKFLKDEFVTDNGILKNAPQIIGSLTKVHVVNGGRNNKVGDIFEVVGGGGERGKVRVSDVAAATGRVDFYIEEGGYGFTTTSDTDIYISDAILYIKNENLLYQNFDIVQQDMEKIDLISFSNIENTVQIGNSVEGKNASGVTVGSGVVTSVTNNGDGSGALDLYMTTGTFGDQKRLTLTGGTLASFLVGDQIVQESSATLTLTSPTAALSVGTKIEQYTDIPMGAKTGTLVLNETNAASYTVGEIVVQFDGSGDMVISGAIVNAPTNNTLKLNNIVTYKTPNAFVNGGNILGVSSAVTSTVLSYTANPIPSIKTYRAVGVITAVSGTSYTLNKVWGEFESSKLANIYLNDATSTILGNCMVSDVNYILRGAKGKISVKTTNQLVVEDVSGVFATTKSIKTIKNDIKRVVSDVVNEGATDIIVNAIPSANAVISSVANTSAYGKIIGQNTTSIGVFGNNHPFLSSGDITIPNTRKDISTLFANFANIVTVEVIGNHGYSVGDALNFSIDLQQNNEIKRIYGVYNVLSVESPDTFTVQMDEDYGNIIRQGDMAFFTAFVSKTITIYAHTERDDGFVSDAIVFDLASGNDANFKIGTLEGEETIFLNTDIIGANNIIDVKYLNMNVDGSDSGIGYVGAVSVISGGTSYSNGAVLTFTGGGYGDGEPDTTAVGFISTSGSGAIVDISITDMGQGYYSAPTITLPATSGTVANLVPLMEYGYGFPKLPEGGIENYLEDLWSIKEMTIGKISSLSEINPGSDYNADPFVFVYNSYIAGFGRTDRIVVDTTGSIMYMVGEQLYQTIPGDGGSILTPKGYVSAISDNTVFVKRMSFNTSFTEGFPLIGSTTGASRTILSISEAPGAMVLGANAIIPANAISADGIATEVEVIDSGFGYVDSQPVTLYDPTKPYIVTGTTSVTKNGISEGTWRSNESHLDSNSKIHDNNYYQEFAYEVVTGKSLVQYRNILNKILHVAGTKMFGKVEKRSFNNVVVKSKTLGVNGNSGFSNAYLRVISKLFSDNESGEILWPNIQDYYIDTTGYDNIQTANTNIGAWRSSVRRMATERKNLFVWSQDYSNVAWNKIGLTATGLNLTATIASGGHRLYQTIRTKKDKIYTVSTFVKSSNTSRVTLHVSGGGITTGFVTFDISTGTVVATSGGYSGAISAKDGYYKISITNSRMITIDGTANISLCLNSDTGIGSQSYTPSIAQLVETKSLQVEYGILATSYQKVMHGDEWDGLKFITATGASPLLARMPLNGVKNILENSDDIKDVIWDKSNVKVKIGGNMLSKTSSRLEDTNDKTARTHYISRVLDVYDYDNVGFVLKPIKNVRYVKISSSSGKEAIFDLFTATNLYNTFEDFTVFQTDEAGVVSIGVYDTTLKNGYLGSPSVIKLSILNGSESSDENYIGVRDKQLDVLRGFVSLIGVKNYDAYAQKNVNKNDVSSFLEEDRWYSVISNTLQRYNTPQYLSNINGPLNSVDNIQSYFIAGVNGMWYEEVDGSVVTTFPTNYEIINALKGVFCVIILTRTMTIDEINYLKSLFKANGSKGDLVYNMANRLTNLSGFTPTTSTITSNEIMTISATTGNIYKNIGKGLYQIKFDYQLAGGATMFKIFVRDRNGVVTNLRTIATTDSIGTYEEMVYLDYDDFGFSLDGTVGSTAKITNPIFRRYDVV